MTTPEPPGAAGRPDDAGRDATGAPDWPADLLAAARAEGVTFALVDGVVVCRYDQPGSPVNTLNSRYGAVFGRLLDALEADPACRALVLASGKPDTWIAGADIEELATCTSPADGERLSRTGQQVMDRIAASRKPIVAAIHGAALGGGLEVALACRHRVASNHPKTVLALPEVQLGLLPGAGGTQRLPRLVGLQAALDMMLTGKTVRAKKALAIGLVDELVHAAIVRDVAIRRARELADGRAPTLPPRRSRAARDRLLDDNALGRAVVFRTARETVRKKTRGHYPAPIAILGAVQAGYAGGHAAGQAVEAREFGRLAVSPESKALVSIFFATTALKKDLGLPPGESATPREVRKLGIVGAGFMGAGIASVAVQQRTPVRLRDASLERIAAGYGAVRAVIHERLARRQLTRLEAEDLLMLIGGTTGWDGFADADLVIEAVFEDLAIKHQVLRECEAAAPRAIFASNTSTIPIARIAGAATRPERVIGMHFFSPVHRMPLLEVIVTPATSHETVATAVQYGRALGKTVIVVADGPGFYVNRILAPYLNEAAHLVAEGVPIEAVDAALTGFGFPVGPFQLLDEVGLDVAGKSGPVLHAAFGDRMAPPAALATVVASGRLGRKGGRGFYRYEQGKRRGPDPEVYALVGAGRARRTMPADAIAQRCVLRMLNEAVRCLDEGILRSARDGDVGAVFGIGFPPFLGGPFRHIDRLGPTVVVQQLLALEAQHPGRFEPAPRLLAMATEGRRFHDAPPSGPPHSPPRP
jgi:3-hydroxyacyl-CoA dehydrogenase/enoyl-CoA hydratase/3-hydroxybutyryl-CoA epimerase